MSRGVSAQIITQYLSYSGGIFAEICAMSNRLGAHEARESHGSNSMPVLPLSTALTWPME